MRLRAGGQIREWFIENFKALGYAGTSLPPLTVLTGPNSSGKSSLLQSILLLAQSDESEIVLNGPLATLGQPGDVIRSGTNAVAIGASLTVPADRWRVAGDLSRTALTFRIELADRGGSLAVTSIAIHREDDLVLDDAPAVLADDSRVNTEHIEEFGKEHSQLSFLRVRSVMGKRAPAYTYLGVAGLEPEVLILRMDGHARVKSWRAALTSLDREEGRAVGGELWRELKAREEILQDLVPGDEFKRILESLASPRGRFSSEEIERILELLSDPPVEPRWRSIPIGRYTGAWRLGATDQSLARTDPAVLAAAQDLSAVADALRALRSAVRYLGPLRAEPRVVSPTGSASRHSPVGPRGEFTADVLVRRERRDLPYFDPQGERRTQPLVERVSVWARYLGIGEGVAVLDQGKLGRGLRVQVGGVARDLTTIGVGASQVLPVLATVLSAPLGSLVLLEQPELHLHPAVQSRLADFFLTARPDLHLIVETHSEYIVTRIRLRAAQRRIEPKRVDLLFAEQVNGQTTMRSLRLDDLGNLEDWPIGFFDSHDADGRDLVAAISARLRSEP